FLIVPAELRNVGLKVSFVSSDGQVETWVYNGGTFTTVKNWSQSTDNEKLLKLENEIENTFQITPELIEQTFTTDIQTQKYEQLMKEIPVETEVEVELLTNNTGNVVYLNFAEFSNGVNRTDIKIGSEIGSKVKFKTKYKAVYGRLQTTTSSSDNTKSAAIRWIEKKSVRFDNLESDIRKLNNETHELKSNVTANNEDIKELQSKAIDEVAKALWSNNQVPAYLDESTLDDLSIGSSYAYYLTPERGVTKITDLTIRFNRIPNGSVKVVALNLGSKKQVELDSFTIESIGVFFKHYDNPLICDEGYDIWVYAPNNTSNLPCVCSHSLDGASLFSVGESLGNLYETKNKAILIIYKDKKTSSEYINWEIEKVKKENENAIEDTHKKISKNESDISLCLFDKYANKTIAYAGDSYANGANSTSTTREGNTYPYDFSVIHPKANVDYSKCVSGTKISGSIRDMVDDLIETYSIKKSDRDYEWTTIGESIKVCDGVVTDFDEIDFIRFKFKYKDKKVNASIVIASYNNETKKITDLKKMGNISKAAFPPASDGTTVWQIGFEGGIKALDGEVLAIYIPNEFTTYGGDICYLGDGNKTFVDIHGNTIQGKPMVECYKNRLDYLILEGGLNDLYQSVPIGEMSDAEDFDIVDFDKSTFYGSLEHIIRNVTVKLWQTKVGFIIMPQMGQGNWQNYIDAIVAVCEKWGVPYLNLHEYFYARIEKQKGKQWSKDFWTLNTDGTFNMHPGTWGYRWMNNIIFHFIDSL
ncbi:MAG: SGNH/GDSL hydrolase family protein, partial [Bacteroides sp.]|uniref:SGNH/GDSL hydrolase family protein n=1 Tax=Bacteroides sp. TaxID=29523 RepID=UPI0026DF1F6D